jgi:hypothetical protein
MKTACEDFREWLVHLVKEQQHPDPGEILQTFDEMHQSRRENTGDRCMTTAGPRWNSPCSCNEIKLYSDLTGTYAGPKHSWNVTASGCCIPTWGEEE